MDIEQFKLIMDMVQSAGEGVFFLAIIYLLIPFVKVVISWMGGIALMIIAAKLAVRGIRAASCSCQVGELLNEDPSTGYGHREIIRWVRRHLE